MASLLGIPQVGAASPVNGKMGDWGDGTSDSAVPSEVVGSRSGKKRRIHIAIEADEELLENRGLLGKLMLIQSWFDLGKRINGKVCSQWEEVGAIY